MSGLVDIIRSNNRMPNNTIVFRVFFMLLIIKYCEQKSRSIALIILEPRVVNPPLI